MQHNGATEFLMAILQTIINALPNEEDKQMAGEYNTHRQTIRAGM